MSPELAALLRLAARNPNAPWNLSYTLDFPYYGLGRTAHRSTTTNRTNQLSFGLEGNLDAIDGGWDFVASHGTTDARLLLARVRGSRARAHLDPVAELRPRLLPRRATRGRRATASPAASRPCTSGVPVFRPHSDITQDCLDAMIVELQHQAEMEQNFVEANVQGKLVEMPAGEARFSAGVHSRENTYRYIFDTLNTQSSFLDLGLGTFPANSTRGEDGRRRDLRRVVAAALERQDRRSST